VEAAPGGRLLAFSGAGGGHSPTVGFSGGRQCSWKKGLSCFFARKSGLEYLDYLAGVAAQIVVRSISDVLANKLVSPIHITLH
jgi:hypothetical protein